MTDHSQLVRLGLFDARVPRYTSYPTAPQFSAQLGDKFFMSQIKALPDSAEISLYIHIPFCRRLCWFCACRTQGTQSTAPIRAYLDTLLAEIRMLGEYLPQGARLSRLHWGGGTPTLLHPDMMDELAAAIHAIAPLGPNSEFSVEIDPNEIDAARLDRLVAAGLNRASIGVQDFDADIQKIIGREQSYEITKEAVDMLRGRGVASLNADILYGLPRQDRRRMADSVQKLLSLSPDRVALYGYAHVPWMAKRQQMIPSDELPTPEERLTLFNTARDLFVWDGYDAIGIDHFARPNDGLARATAAGQLKRNFQGYTDDQARCLIGLGASAISRFPGGYTQNAPATSAYTQRIRAGQFATSRGHAFAGEDLMRARMIEALMCDFRIDAREITAKFNISSADLHQMFTKVDQQFDGLLLVSNDLLMIPESARPLTRMVARAFDAYDLSKAGHSSAV